MQSIESWQKDFFRTAVNVFAAEYAATIAIEHYQRIEDKFAASHDPMKRRLAESARDKRERLKTFRDDYLPNAREQMEDNPAPGVLNQIDQTITRMCADIKAFGQTVHAVFSAVQTKLSMLFKSLTRASAPARTP